MPRHPASAAVLAGLFVVLAAIPSLRASKTTLVPSPGDVRLDPLARAHLFAASGEPRLAWDALRDAGRDAGDSDRLAARLLTELGRPAAAESLLARIVTRSHDDAFFIALVRARLLLDAGHAPGAIDLLRSIENTPTPDPAFTAYRDYLLGCAHAARGQGAEAAAALERAEGSASDALRPLLAEASTTVYRSLGRATDALRAAESAAESTRDARERRRLQNILYDVARDANDAAHAERTLARMARESPGAPETEACAMDYVSRANPTNDALLACARVFDARSRAEELRRTLRLLDERDLPARDVEEHRLLWARYHYQTGDYSRAIALARPTYSDAGMRRDSMLLLARSLRRVGRPADAAVMYERFAENFPNDGISPDALFTAASIHRQAGRDRESARVLDELRHAYPSTFHGWAAAIERAQDFERDGDVKDAVAIYEQRLSRSRRTDEAALYYLARTVGTDDAARGDLLLDELRRLNPRSFYATPDVEARRAVPDAAGAGGASWLATAAAEREQAYARVQAAMTTSPAAPGGAFARGRRFLEAGLRDWAERELDVARSDAGSDASRLLELARLFDEHAMPWRSVRLYERARGNIAWETRRTLAGDFRFLMYPLPFPAQVLDNANRLDLPAHLIYGMIREESLFEVDVVSRAGAVGLMQLMPETARRIARRLDMPVDVDDRLGEPAVNVSIGVRYAADLMESGDGSVAWMLAAYNAGPAAAERWLSAGVRGEAAIDAVDSIEYKETRGYVKRVVESANLYHDLYFSRVPAAR